LCWAADRPVVIEKIHYRYCGLDGAHGS
jgi:hypothetical protein